MHRDARLVSDAAMRDAAVQLCLLQEDLGLLRTVRVYGMENVDKQRFDEHLERFREADARRIKTEGRLNPTIGLLYGAAAILALGLLGYNVVVTQPDLAGLGAACWSASLAGLIYPILAMARGCGRSIRQANRSAGGDLRVPRTQARAAPARRRPLPAAAAGPDHASRTSPSRAARAGCCSKASRPRSRPGRGRRS